MSEFLGSTSELFQPGNIIELTNLNELIVFEDLIVEDVDPDYDEFLWEARENLDQYKLLVPPNFHGSLRNIELFVMDNPYDRLVDANQRGWTFKSSSSRSLELKTEYSQKSLTNHYRGFALTAEAHSSGKGMVGQIQAEMWYYPVPPTVLKAGTRHRGYYLRKDGSRIVSYSSSKKDRIVQNYDSPDAVRRVITKPKFERDSYIKLEATNRRIGMIALNELRNT